MLASMTLGSVMTSTSADVSQTSQPAVSVRIRELDDDRRVVGGLRSLSRLAIAICRTQPRKDRFAHKSQIDAHAPPLVKGAGAVVPPGEGTDLLRVHDAHRVTQAPALDLRQGCALRGGHVRHPFELRDVPDVSVLRCDIEVTEDGD